MWMGLWRRPLQETWIMNSKRRTLGATKPRALGLLVVVALVVGACNASASPLPASQAPAASTAASASVAPAITPVPLPPNAPGPNGGTVVSWFVGLGAGGQPQQLAAEANFVDAFNKS